MILTKLVNRVQNYQAKVLAWTIGLGLSLLATNNASADSGWVARQEGAFKAISPIFGVPNGGAPIDPRVYIANIISVVLGFLGVLCVILMIYAGFTWMTAAGEKDKVEKAQKTMLAAVIGLLIFLASFAISYFVARALVASTSPDGYIPTKIIK